MNKVTVFVGCRISWDGQKAWERNNQLADACSLLKLQTPTTMRLLDTQLTSTSSQLQPLCNAQCALHVCTSMPLFGDQCADSRA